MLALNTYITGLVLLFFLSCGADIGARLPQTPGAAERWMLVPDLRVGSADRPNYSLTQVWDLGVDDRGSIYVAQPMEAAVRVYDKEGRFVTTIGSGGPGPGEFGLPAKLGWRGDTLWVLDGSRHAISMFGPGGEYVGSVSFLTPSGSDLLRHFSPGTLLADGSVLSIPPTPSQFIADGLVRFLPIIRLDRDGVVLDTISQLSVRNSSLTVRSPAPWRGSMHSRQPLSDAPLHVVTRDGTALLLVDRSTTETPGPARFRITKVDPRGDTIYSRDYAYSPRPIPPAWVDSLLDSQVARSAERFPSPAAAREAVRDALFLPPYFPPVSAVVAGRDGTIWLRREQAGGTVATWNVLDASGELLAVTTAPQHLQIYAADAEFAWGVEHDEMDIPYVVRYRVVRRQQQG